MVSWTKSWFHNSFNCMTHSNVHALDLSMSIGVSHTIETVMEPKFGPGNHGSGHIKSGHIKS